MPASAVTASRSASSRLSLPPPAASMLARCTRSIRPATAISGSAPFACACARAASAFAALPAVAASSMAMESLRPGRPSIAAILSASILSAVIAAAWSSSDKASRTDPSAARAITCKASGAASIASRVQMLARWVANTSLSTRRRSKRWQRDRMVTGTLRISVVAKMNFTLSGGSSSVFNNALKALFDIICTSSMM